MGLVLFATFDGSDIFTDPKRTGYVAMAQIPIVVALATKNNVLSWLSGEGYEKVSINLITSAAHTQPRGLSSTIFTALVVVWRSWRRTSTALATVSCYSSY